MDKKIWKNNIEDALKHPNWKMEKNNNWLCNISKQDNWNNRGIYLFNLAWANWNFNSPTSIIHGIVNFIDSISFGSY